MRKLNQKGAVSLLSTMIFATIVTVLITAYMMTALAQQRQAATHDFSTRAYYTAESGIQDAIRALNDGLPIGDSDDCTPLGEGVGTVGVVGINLAYTCQLVTEGVNGAPGIIHDVTTNQTAMIRLNPQDRSISGPYRLVIRWSPSNPLEPRYARGVAASVFPVASTWRQGGSEYRPIHSLMRVGVIDHPQTNFSRGDVRQRVTFLNPTMGTSSSVDSDPAGRVVFQNSDGLSRQQIDLINYAECYDYGAGGIPAGHTVAGAGSYLCRRTIELGTGYSFGTREIYVRISPFYRDTRFYLELQSADGNAIDLEGGQATIDVTGRAANGVFRRVQQVVNASGDIVLDDGPDAAVVVAEGICKHFAVSLSQGGFIPGCDPLE